MNVSGGSEPSAAGLSAPEYVLLLNQSAGRGEVMRAALVETIGRGLLAIRPRRVKGLLRTRTQQLVVPGPRAGQPVPAVLAPVPDAFGRAPGTVDVEGDRGVAVPQLVMQVQRSLGTNGYRDQVMLALVARGLVEPGRRRGLLARGPRLTAAGVAEQARARARLEAARAHLPVLPGADSQVLLAASAALAGVGVLLLVERDLLAGLQELRRAEAAGANGAVGGSAPPDQESEEAELEGLDLGALDLGVLDLGTLDALDAGALAAIDSGADSGSGGGDGGGGDGGG